MVHWGRIKGELQELMVLMEQEDAGLLLSAVEEGERSGKNEANRTRGASCWP